MSDQKRRLEFESQLTPSQIEDQRRYLLEQEEKSPKNIAIRFLKGVFSFITDIPNMLSNAWANDLMQQIMIIFGIIVILVAAIFGINALIHHFTDQGNWTGVLNELHYRREIYTQEYSVTSDSNWRDQIPALGYNVTFSESRIRSYRTESYWAFNGCSRFVDDSYTDSKGKRHYDSHTEYYSCTKTRQVPVYDDWYTYTINQWVTVKTAVSEVRENRNERKLEAVWPTPDKLMREFGTKDCSRQQLGTSELKIIDGQSNIPQEQYNDPMLGCQRLSGSRGEAYYITYSYTIGKKPFLLECPIDYSSWTLLRVGEASYGKYYMHNEGVACEDSHIGIAPTSENK